MNTIGLKIAGGVLALFVALIVVAKFVSPEKSQSRPEPVAQTEPKKPKDIYDVAAEDEKKYAIPPEAPVVEDFTDAPVATPSPEVPSAPTAAPKPVTIYVKPLEEIENIQAQQLYSAVIPGKSIGGLRAGYNLTVQNAKQIIKTYPDSIYAYQSKRVLAAIPERYRVNYKLTDQLLDTSMFLKPRPGTQALQLPPED
jgi:hypothetical protein